MHTTPPPLPDHATDTHVHVFDPARFAFDTARRYTPGAATAETLRARDTRLGLKRVVLVQPSPYGTHNTCMLDAIDRLGQHARGIAVVDMARVRHDELLALDAAGVRGIRLNLEVRHEADPARVADELAQAAALSLPPSWCVQVHAAASLLPVLLRSLGDFRVPLVLDHFAGLRAADAEAPGGAPDRLLELLASGQVYLKLSAFYRASGDAPHYADLAPLVRRLIAARPDRLLWGSDWPHTGGGHGERDPARIEPFRSVDLAASLHALSAWAGDDAVLRQILVTNPAALYGFGPDRP